MDGLRTVLRTDGREAPSYGVRGDAGEAVGFEMRPEGLFLVTFGLTGVKQRQWPWRDIRSIQIVHDRTGSDILSFVDSSEQTQELLQGRSDVLNEIARLIRPHIPHPGKPK